MYSMDDMLHIFWLLGGSIAYLKWYINIIVNGKLICAFEEMKFIFDFPFTFVL